jgi:hypothetical protein
MRPVAVGSSPPAPRSIRPARVGNLIISVTALCHAHRSANATLPFNSLYGQ